MSDATREWYLRAARELTATSARQLEWCLGVADDARMLALLDALPLPARQPSLLFAVAAYLGAPDAAYPVWAEHVREHWREVAAELVRRRVQTNEPGRTAPLAALGRVVADAPTDATLVVATLGTAVYLPQGTRAGLLATVRTHGARAVTFEARAALPEVAERWAALAADGRVDPAAGFVLALDGEPIASGNPHGTRLTSPVPPVPESTHFGGRGAPK